MRQVAETHRRISIHALRVEGDDLRSSRAGCSFQISIHALRVEGDSIGASCIAKAPRFLSTPSGWRATTASLSRRMYESNFYPRPPGGGRQYFVHYPLFRHGISIHALRVEGDALLTFLTFSITYYFYPRPPGGGRRLSAERLSTFRLYFYPRPPGGGRHLPSRANHKGG